jgi:oxygen-dependent protoporphyrinogen oxidase
MNNYDVIVIGGGIAGLAAALRLKDRGLKAVVLESDRRVGGRMTTDRREGFVIDRGVTLLGNRFGRMRALTNRLGLQPLVHPVRFNVALEGRSGVRLYRGSKPGDILCDGTLSKDAKAAFLRFSLDMILHCRALSHGRSDRAASIDTMGAREYLEGMGAGGAELFESVFEPGLNGPVGGSLARVSRAILMQTVWNLLVNGQWNLGDGVDRIPEAIAAQVEVRTGTRVLEVTRVGEGVEVRTETETLAARAAILAVPGHLVPRLCPALPPWITEPLGRTVYARMASAHVALRRPPERQVAGYGFAGGLMDGVEMELEHLRARGRCPEGRGMVSVFMWDTPEFRPTEADDGALEARAVEAVRRAFPDAAGQEMFVHPVRWPAGICRFPAGRITEMIGLRRQLAESDLPFDLCGDYLDGLASEGALRTGEQAADRTADRLAA